MNTLKPFAKMAYPLMDFTHWVLLLAVLKVARKLAMWVAWPKVE